MQPPINKTTTMKKIIFSLLIVCGVVCGAMAQQPNPTEVIKKSVETLAAEYKYTPEQQQKITDILTERQAEIRKINNANLGDGRAAAAQKCNAKYEGKLDELLGAKMGRKVVQQQMNTFKEMQNK